MATVKEIQDELAKGIKAVETVTAAARAASRIVRGEGEVDVDTIVTGEATTQPRP